MPSSPEVPESRSSSGLAFVCYIAAAKLLLHLFTAGRYGFFGDELYYLACAEHLDWGYVDQPPLIALLAWFSRHVFGESLFALHILPAFAGAARVLLTGLLARELGARRFGMVLASLASACLGVSFVLEHLFSMNAFEPLLWMGCALLIIRIIKTGNEKLWLWFGVLAGIGLENKYSMAVFGFAVVLGLLLTPERKHLANKWLWLGGAIAFLIFLPNLLWNIRHHWPFFELMRNIRASGRDIELGPLAFLLQQIFVMSPVTFPVWLAGLLYFFFSPNAKRFRALGWTFLLTFLIFLLSKGKDYYVAPAYPMLFAAGGIAWENFIDRTRLVWLKPAIVIALLVVTALLLPIGLPVLSVENFVRYQEKLPFKLPASERSHLEASLPHYYAWSFGWEEMVAAVARVYASLPPEERAKTAIVGNNFAESGAIDFFGPRYGLPKSIGVHQSYWLWGPRNYTGEIMIVLGDRPESLQRWCAQVEVAAELHNPYARPVENRPVLICRGLKEDFQSAWPRAKKWD
jgi:hypothetical protein